MQETWFQSLVQEGPTCHGAKVHGPQLLGLCSGAQEPQLLSPHSLEPVLCSRGTTEMRSPHTATSEKPLLITIRGKAPPTKSPHSHKQTIIFNFKKSKQTGPKQIYKLLHSKGNHKHNEETTYRMGENTTNNVTNKGLISTIYKQLIQFNNNNKSNQKIGRTK